MTDMHQLAGAYVLDALDDEEREAFEAYLITSPATAAEVESLREVSGLLGAAAAATPPEGLRRAVMARVDSTRQLPPVLPPPAKEDRAPSPPAAPGRATAVDRPAGGRASGAADAAGTATVTALDDARARRLTWITQAVGAVAAVAVAVALGLAVTAIDLSNRLDAVEQTSAQVAMLAAAPDTARFETAYPAGGTVTAMISTQHGAFAVADGLPELDDDRIYALWGLTDEGPVPIGPLRNGRALAVRLEGIAGLGLTVEPDGPLSQPTGAVQATLGA